MSGVSGTPDGSRALGWTGGVAENEKQRTAKDWIRGKDRGALKTVPNVVFARCKVADKSNSQVVNS